MAYERINWENAPSTDTPLNADNLNAMDNAISNLSDNVDSLTKKTNNLQDGIDLANARMDTLVAVPPGSTTSNTELLDIRLGSDGTTYNSAGAAVRGQIGDLNNAVDVVEDDIDDILTMIVPVFSPGVYNKGDIVRYENDLYECIAKTTSGAAWDSTKWSSINLASLIRYLHDYIAKPYASGGTVQLYDAGALCFYDHKLYRSLEAMSVLPSTPFDSTKWKQVSIGRILTELSEDITNLKSEFKDQIGDIEDVDYCTSLHDTYTGTAILEMDVNITAGAYIIDVDSIESTDTDSTGCNVAFVYTTSGGAYALLSRGSNIQKRLTLENDVKQIVFYASDSYAHSTGDTFTFTGFKLLKDYQLREDIIASRDTKNAVESIIEDLSEYEEGERTYTTSRLTFPYDGKVAYYDNSTGYDTYEYSINRPTLFKVTGKTKGASNYLAFGADNDGNVLQTFAQGQSGTETQYTDYTFMVDASGVTKVYICLYVSANDSVQIGTISGGGVSDYDELENRPQINGVTMTGNKTLSDLGLADSQEVSRIKNLQGDVVLSETYSGTGYTSVSVSIPAGTYTLDIDSVASSDTDTTVCFVNFVYSGSGSLGLNVNRGNNIHKQIVLEKSVTTIYLYASDGYAHSTGDTFTFTDFQLSKRYPLTDGIEQNKNTRDAVKELIASLSTYETGTRIYTSSWFVYSNNGIIASGTLSGYDTYEYTIDCPTMFKVTGKTKGASNYLAIVTDDSGNILQLINQGTAGTETQYTDYVFTIDALGVAKVYICLLASENDSVQIGAISSAGVSDYDVLTSKPAINNVTLTGNKSTSDLGLVEAEEVSQIKNLQGNTVLSETYSGTTLATISVNIPKGTYTLEIEKLTSADVDTELSLVTFVYSGGSLSVRLSRGLNIKKKIALKGDVTTIYLYASDSYAHSVGDAFSFTGFKLTTGYTLKDDVDDLSQTVQGLSGRYTAYEAGARTFIDNTLAYIGSNSTITLASNAPDYAVYKYEIAEPTTFIVTGSTRGASNYLAIAANDSGTRVQEVEPGASGTTKSYSSFEFTIDDPNAKTVYICLYKQATDDVRIKLDKDVKELSILFVGNSLTQDGISYLPYLLTKYYPGFRFRFYMWYNGGYDLSQQYAKFTADTECEAFSIAENSPAWTNTTAKMSDILSAYKFNIVCMQEYFNRKESYTDTDLTDWNNCRDYIVSHYMGGNALEFISLFHSPWMTDEQTVYNLTKTGNALILKKTLSDDMIATGIALHMARSTDLDSLGDQGHLTPDTIHAQEGLPCLLETYTALLWVLDRYGFPTSIYGLPFKMTAGIQSSIAVPGANMGTGVIEGTDAQNLLAQEVAIMAYKVGKKFVADNLA